MKKKLTKEYWAEKTLSSQQRRDLCEKALLHFPDRILELVTSDCFSSMIMDTIFAEGKVIKDDQIIKAIREGKNPSKVIYGAKAIIPGVVYAVEVTPEECFVALAAVLQHYLDADKKKDSEPVRNDPRFS